MSENPSHPKPARPLVTYEGLLYIAAFVLALFLRFFRLGAAPLNDLEAQWALQALEIARSAGSAALNQAQIGAQPLYVILTSWLFLVFKEANAVARLLPALAGTLLVCLPWMARPVLQVNPILRRAGIFLAFALAVDPALVLLSRTAGSSMLAISFTLISITLALVGRQHGSFYFRWSAVFAALALLAGPDLLSGALVLGLTALLGLATHNFYTFFEPEEASKVYSFSLQDGLAGLVTLLAVGLGFLTLPQGAAGFSATLPEYFKTWFIPSGVPALRLPAAVFLYQPAAIIFGLVGVLRAWAFHDETDDSRLTALSRWLSAWALIAAVLPLLQQGRQVSQMAWVVIPLWCLAAVELARHQLSTRNAPLRTIALLAALIVGIFLVMGIYYGLYMSGLPVTIWQSLLLIAGIIAMAAIVVILVGIGWDVEIASLSIVWSTASILIVWMLASTWSQGLLRPNHPSELWSNGSVVGQGKELIQTLEQLSAMKAGQRTMLDVVMIDPSPSLRWLLRAFPNTSVQAGIAANQLPAAIITIAGSETPALLASYRGQDFDWRITAGWAANTPPDLSRWLYTHQAPVITEKVILWVRGDVFPGGELKQPASDSSVTP